jgi:hypothetical protein
MRLLSRSVLLLIALGVLPMLAQSGWQPGHSGIGFTPPRSRQWVQLVSFPQQAVQANAKHQVVTLRFTIQTGMHINSHTPHSPFLIPTTFTLDHADGVQAATIEYPSGSDYRFQFSPNDSLSVYTGEFSLLVPVRARPGQYTLHGQLRYQACDNRSCNPPENLPITLDIAAK